MNTSTGLLRRPALEPDPAPGGARALPGRAAPAASTWLAANWQRLALPALLLGPVAYAAQTIGTPHIGSVPSAGPASAGGIGGGAGGGMGGGVGGGIPTGMRLHGTPPSGAPTRALRGGGTGDGTMPTAGGAGAQATVSAALTRALVANAGHYRWVAATSGSQSAASLELATGGEPVMAIGGFSGQGGELSLAQFEGYVNAGDIHYYIASGGGGPSGGAGSSSAITSWVKAHYRAVTIGGQTLYDLTQPLS